MKQKRVKFSHEVKELTENLKEINIENNLEKEEKKNLTKDDVIKLNLDISTPPKIINNSNNINRISDPKNLVDPKHITSSGKKVPHIKLSELNSSSMKNKTRKSVTYINQDKLKQIIDNVSSTEVKGSSFKKIGENPFKKK